MTVGIGAVPVHAKDEAAKCFYMKHVEFIECPKAAELHFCRRGCA